MIHTFEDDQKNGICKYLNRDGSTIVECFFKNNKMHGDHIRYFKNGGKFITTFENGEYKSMNKF